MSVAHNSAKVNETMKYRDTKMIVTLVIILSIFQFS